MCVGMSDIYSAYFESSHPDADSRFIASMHYTKGACKRAPHSYKADPLLCRDEEITSGEDFISTAIKELDPFTIIIDVNRPDEVSVEANFVHLLTRLQPGGMLVVENLMHLYRKSETTLQIENDGSISQLDSSEVISHRLHFFKTMIDLVNNFHILEPGYYASLSKTDKYCASWIEQIAFNDGVVIVHKKKKSNTFFETLMSGSHALDRKHVETTGIILRGRQLGYFRNTERFLGTKEVSGKSIDPGLIPRNSLPYVDGIISKGVADLVDERGTLMQLHGTSFEFDEWDVLAGTNALKVRAEIYCTKHRLHSSTVDCVSNLTDLAEFTINVNNEGFDKLLVRDQIFTYSKRLHIDTNKLFERALSFCDYFGYEESMISLDKIELTSCSYGIFEAAMNQHMNIGNLTLASSGIDPDVVHSFMEVPRDLRHKVVFIDAHLAPNKYVASQNVGKGVSKGFTVLLEILNTMDRFGLMDKAHVVYVSLLGIPSERKIAKAAMKAWPKVCVLFETSDSDNFKATSINLLRSYIREISNDSLVLYAHTKGSTKYRRYLGDQQHLAEDDWRRYMLYFLVEKWGTCVSALSSLGYKSCGVQLTFAEVPYYNGNFWWATGAYLKDVLGNEEKDVHWILDQDDSLSVHLLKDMDKENGQSLHLSLHHIDHDLYTTRTPRSMLPVLM